MIALLVACADTPTIPLHFDGPVAVAVLPAGEGGPFEEPVGFAASSRDGTIVPLDLKSGRLLTDDRMASFLRASSLATGRTRILHDVAVRAEDGTITVWAIDIGSDELLRVPYIIDIDDDGAPVEVEAQASEPLFVDADGSGDAPTLTEVLPRNGFTTTEDWSIEYDGVRWWAKGSRSGTQVAEPVPGEEYHTDDWELSFVLDGTATAGDRFDLRTDTGIDVFSLSGMPSAVLHMEGRLYVTVLAEGELPARVVVLNASSGGYIGSVALPDGAEPWRMAAAGDGRVFVADSALPNVWVLRFDAFLDPASTPVESIVTAAPAIDVAVQSERLFVAPVALQRVDVYDLAAGAWVDPNPITPGVEGVPLGAPVSGLAASAGTVWLQQESAWGGRARVPTVAIATQDGFVYELDATTGCGVVTERGPHGPNAYADTGSDGTWAALEDQGEPSSSVLAADDATGEQIQVSPCGGVARSETWTVVYDSAQLSWSVEGSVSGVQAARAFDDVRYLNDDGAISFLIQSGPRPPTDGDRFTFSVKRELLTFAGTDVDEDGAIGSSDRPWEFPGRPVGFSFTTGPTGGGWDVVDRRECVLLPVTNSDLVARLMLDSGEALVDWQ